MKRGNNISVIFCVVTFLFIFGVTKSFAQDTLFCKNNTQIIGKVLEVDVSVLRYVRADNPDRPVYVIKREDIASVHYQNGVIDIFEDDEHTFFDRYAGLPIEKRHHDYYFEGIEKGMSRSEYKDFIEINCPKAWRQFKGWRAMETVGIPVTAVGGIMLFAGIATFSDTYSSLHKQELINAKEYKKLCEEYNSQLTVIIVGGALLGAGVSMLVVGHTFKFTQSVNTYNQLCVPKQTATLSVGVSPTSMGITINF